MTDLQLYLAVGLATMAVISSLIVSMFQISGIRGDIREIRSDIKLLTGKVVDIDTRMSLLEERLR